MRIAVRPGRSYGSTTKRGRRRPALAALAFVERLLHVEVLEVVENDLGPVPDVGRVRLIVPEAAIPLSIAPTSGPCPSTRPGNWDS